MKNYKVSLTSLGTITQVPDSQKLFGALVYMYSEEYGNDAAAKLTKQILDKKIHITLSNLLPCDYLPTPQEYLIDKISQHSRNDIDLKKKRAAIKERSYLKLSQLNEAIKDPINCEQLYPYVKQQNIQQLRASLDNVTDFDTKLYSVPCMTLSEITVDEEVTSYVNKFSFYFQMDNSTCANKVYKMLVKAVNEQRIMILGKRASQGLNMYRFVDIEEQEQYYTSTGYFLNTGMLLPDHIDYHNSTLKIFTSERRPFEMQGGWNKKCSKYFMSFIAEGSVISVPERVECTGKSIESLFNKERDIVFGNAFLFHLPQMKGGN
ncbi:type III-A CRISPR-associated RAMP protein Csm4 [Robinsoniella sp. KNHs210]|uniref:type III-A CRISPR-associated RAMP protein Csm4 n=1 Tax=Robinsoniella sp. KNHs210 TaxID=1469950 RepID=UPI000486E862|nr:hypothetical protein [Robinsoniella sp. KNHs210]